MSSRIALAVEYSGLAYHGWQLQANPALKTLEGTLSQALSRVAAEPIQLVCAGRTDAGVHATHQVVHFDTQACRQPQAWVLGGNSALPPDIRILWAQEVPLSFQARFGAHSRTYQYILRVSPVAPAILRSHVSWYVHPVEVSQMNQAAQRWLGEHDFSSFRAKGCQAQHPIRTLEFAEVRQRGPWVVCTFRANAFLYHMIRNMMGTLLEIGSGKRPLSWASEILALRDRRAAGMTALPNGLYFTGVEYPDHFQLPSAFRSVPIVEGI